MPARRAEEMHAADARDFLAARRGLGHLRVRRRAELLILESGPDDDPIPHARLRRVAVHLWTLECATHTGRWEKTGFRDRLEPLLELLVTTLPWVVVPLG
ncbi:MAG: hypothetical protein HYV09_22125 [Deltaproteobacteria bacterium]|nr:hypothetical protein [Deltaproteobacteria bacterium]